MAISKTGRIGVMATRSTLTSARFQTLLAAQAGVAEFVLQPCYGLADAIERGASTDDATEIIAACARHTGAMGLFGTQPGHIDTLVPGCTHYPFVSEHLQALVGVDVTLVGNRRGCGAAGAAAAVWRCRKHRPGNYCAGASRLGQHGRCAHPEGGCGALAGTA